MFLSEQTCVRQQELVIGTSRVGAKSIVQTVVKENLRGSLESKTSKLVQHQDFCRAVVYKVACVSKTDEY